MTPDRGVADRHRDLPAGRGGEPAGRPGRRAAAPVRRPRPGRTAAALLGGLLVATACSAGSPDLEAHEAFIPEPVDERIAGGFLVVENHGDADDTLTGVTTDEAASVELHETVDNAMREVDSLTVPAGGRLELSRGGSHLMLHDLGRQVRPGEKVALELHFEKSDPITLDVPVESATHTGR